MGWDVRERPVRAAGTTVLTAAVLLLFGALGGVGAGADKAGSGSKARIVANLWVDRSGGRCTRSQRAVTYRDSSACGSLDTAWRACKPGDRIVVKAGVYSAQTITGDKASPGCSVVGIGGVRIGDLTTRGRFFTLRNVVVDVGGASRAGWTDTASNVRLANVRMHGSFVSVDIHDASHVSWIGGELGRAGRKGGARVCGRDALPVQIGDATHVRIDRVRFHPQGADHTPSACSANGFHLEMIRLDGGTSSFRLRSSTFDSGDDSGTATIFITQPGGDISPHDLVFENNFFGTNDASVGSFDSHANVSACRDFTFAYNTFLEAPGLFQCGSVSNVRWIGNLGGSGPSSSADCFGASLRNVWQVPKPERCGSDKWISGPRDRSNKLGLGGRDGFHLKRGSPAIDAGEAAGYCVSALGARDHDQGRRPYGRRCDAGADEYRRGPRSWHG